ncbi:MAG: Unknown protein [uncultured Aureispira sp.]|uniref:Uncharacterized protein n=1 Tax=uncultured Aureispira sp. TaxID=1331704 RepID=A0A6S6TFI1_9BACT|nr:MAG: Unknown protein [uncultured Aureispira sp.]
MTDFFKSTCQTKTNAALFGICDDNNQPEAPAYLNDTDSNTWSAEVRNDQKIEVTFTAIDNCIPIFRANGEMESRIDGLLTYNSNRLIFVELKIVRERWIPDGIEQLENTIELFSAQNDLSSYKKRRAFLANKKHPRFKFSHKETMQAFKNKTGVRLIITAKIKL